jgi:hypothetical protein
MEQVEQLEAASRLVKEPLGWKYEDHIDQLEIDLPPHAVAAITLEFGPEQREGGVRS